MEDGNPLSKAFKKAGKKLEKTAYQLTTGLQHVAALSTAKHRKSDSVLPDLEADCALETLQSDNLGGGLTLRPDTLYPAVAAPSLLTRTTTIKDVSNPVPMGAWWLTGDYVLLLVVHAARNLPPLDPDTNSADPFARVHIGNPNGGNTPAMVASTRCVYRSRNPSWEESFLFPLARQEESTRIRTSLHSFTGTGNAPMGQVSTTLGLLLSHAEEGKPLTRWYRLGPRTRGIASHAQSMGVEEGDVMVSTMIVDRQRANMLAPAVVSIKHLSTALLQKRTQGQTLQVTLLTLRMQLKPRGDTSMDAAAVIKAMTSGQLLVKVQIGRTVATRTCTAKEVTGSQEGQLTLNLGGEFIMMPLNQCFQELGFWDGKRAKNEMGDIRIYLVHSRKGTLAKTQIPCWDVPTLTQVQQVRSHGAAISSHKPANPSEAKTNVDNVLHNPALTVQAAGKEAPMVFTGASIPANALDATNDSPPIADGHDHHEVPSPLRCCTSFAMLGVGFGLEPLAIGPSAVRAIFSGKSCSNEKSPEPTDMNGARSDDSMYTEGKLQYCRTDAFDSSMPDLSHTAFSETSPQATERALSLSQFGTGNAVRSSAGDMDIGSLTYPSGAEFGATALQRNSTGPSVIDSPLPSGVTDDGGSLDEVVFQQSSTMDEGPGGKKSAANRLSQLIKRKGANARTFANSLLGNGSTSLTSGGLGSISLTSGVKVQNLDSSDLSCVSSHVPSNAGLPNLPRKPLGTLPSSEALLQGPLVDRATSQDSEQSNRSRTATGVPVLHGTQSSPIALPNHPSVQRSVSTFLERSAPVARMSMPTDLPSTTPTSPTGATGPSGGPPMLRAARQNIGRVGSGLSSMGKDYKRPMDDYEMLAATKWEIELSVVLLPDEEAATRALAQEQAAAAKAHCSLVVMADGDDPDDSQDSSDSAGDEEGQESEEGDQVTPMPLPPPLTSACCDSTLGASPATVFAMLFTADNPFFVRAIQAEKLTELKVEAWALAPLKPGAVPPEGAKRQVTYVRPLFIPMGPKSAAVNEEHVVVTSCAGGWVVTVRISTSAPKGDSFYIDMQWAVSAVGSGCRLVVTASFVVTKSLGFLKSVVEAGALSGSRSSVSNRVKDIQDKVGQDVTVKTAARSAKRKGGTSAEPDSAADGDAQAVPHHTAPQGHAQSGGGTGGSGPLPLWHQCLQTCLLAVLAFGVVLLAAGVWSMARQLHGLQDVLLQHLSSQGAVLVDLAAGGGLTGVAAEVVMDVLGGPVQEVVSVVLGGE